MDKQKYIIRCDRADVFYAEIESRQGGEAKLRNARRLWCWDGAASLSQLALEGVKNPRGCKFTVTVPSMTVLDVIEVIPCAEEAVNSIEAVPVWKI